VTHALKSGANPNAVDDTGFTMLHSAAVRDDTDVISALLAGGAELGATTPQGMSAIHLAARSNRPQVLEVLAAQGLNVNARDDNDDTPMRLAVFYGNCDAAVTLLRLGAKPDMAYLNHAPRQENVEKRAWETTLHRLNGAMSLIRANHLKKIRLQQMRRRTSPAMPS